MKKLFSISCFPLFLFISNLASAQQWIDEQKEVLKTVQNYVDLYASNNLAEVYNFVDNSYWGWSYNGRGALYIITPLKVWVSGDSAYVHYTFEGIYEMNDGKIIRDDGQRTHILMKKDGKWLFVGDHGGSTKK